MSLTDGCSFIYNLDRLLTDLQVSSSDLLVTHPLHSHDAVYSILANPDRARYLPDIIHRAIRPLILHLQACGKMPQGDHCSR